MKPPTLTQPIRLTIQLILGGIILGAAYSISAISFNNPHLTQTQLFTHYWLEYAGLAALLISSAALFEWVTPGGVNEQSDSE